MPGALAVALFLPTGQIAEHHPGLKLQLGPEVIGILLERNLNNGQPSFHAALIAASVQRIWRAHKLKLSPSSPTFDLYIDPNIKRLTGHAGCWRTAIATRLPVQQFRAAS